MLRQVLLRRNYTNIVTCYSSYSQNQQHISIQEIQKSSLKDITEPVLDDSTINLLERLSLVNFGSEKSKEILKDAIKFADKIHSVHVEGVEPLINVLEEDHETPVRQDKVEMYNTMEDVMLNAKHIEEDYFIAPPSNIPILPTQDAIESLSEDKSQRVIKR